MRKILLAALGVALLGPPAHADYNWEGVPAGYGLAWSDEFNGTLGSAPNSANWNYDTGATGWGNNELENYTNSTQNSQIVADPKAVDGKALGIIEIDTNPTSTAYSTVGRYTSARLLSLGKQSFPYSYIVARIRMPYGQGIWPAYWMMGNDINSVGWPACGEVDTMENIGNATDQPICHGSLHDGPSYTNEVNWGSTFTLPGGQLFHTAYHTFATLRVANQIQFFVDGNLYETVNASSQAAGTSWAFNDTSHQFFVLLNTAVGGGWPGAPDATTSFPQTMLVDDVRVYEPGLATPTPVVQSTWRIRCGGDTYVDSQGNTWVADTNFTGGSPSATGNAVSGTVLPAASDATLYQYERFGNTTGGETVTYTFNVPTGGNYQVTLKLMENYWTAAGQRKFNLSINGTAVLSQFDIFATAGGQNKALDEVFNNISPDANGQIVLQFTQGAADNPKVDAIQILSMSATPTPSATPSSTPTFTPSRTLTVTPSRTPTGTPTFTPSFTATATPSRTPSPTSTGTASTTPTASTTATPTSSPTLTASFTPSHFFTFTPSSTPSFTPTSTVIFSPTPSSTPTASTTSTSTFTPLPLSTFTPTANAGVVLFPNPAFGPSVNVLPPSYTDSQDVRVEIFTLSFRKVLDTAIPNTPSGTAVTVILDDRWGKPLADGLYYVVVTVNGGHSVGKLLILR